MAFSGDTHNEDTDKRPAIRLETKVQFTNEGLVSEVVEEPTYHYLSDVIQVIEGDVKEVLHLIGYRIYDTKSLLDNNILKATDEVTEGLQKLGPRPPGSHILVHNNTLYGVVVNHSNECRVVGRITSVVPNKELNDRLNLVIVDGNGVQTFCRSTDSNIEESIKSGSILCMVSHKGFAFVETNERTTDDIPDLVLVLYRGYILFEGVAIDWLRLQTGLRINEFVVKKTTIADKECIICLHGGYVREGDRLLLYGSQNGVLQFDAFLAFANDLQTIGFQSGQHITREDIDELPAEDSDSKVVSNSVIELQENESNAESKDSIDSDYDNISPDSFS